MTGLAGRHALVTGVIGGIGAAIAMDLAARGARVTITDQPGPAFDSAAAALGLAGITADLGDRDQVGKLADELAEDPPLIIVNAAGGVCGQVGQPVDKVETEDWHRILAPMSTARFILRIFLPPP